MGERGNHVPTCGLGHLLWALWIFFPRLGLGLCLHAATTTAHPWQFCLENEEQQIMPLFYFFVQFLVGEIATNWALGGRDSVPVKTKWLGLIRLVICPSLHFWSTNPDHGKYTSRTRAPDRDGREVMSPVRWFLMGWPTRSAAKRGRKERPLQPCYHCWWPRSRPQNLLGYRPLCITRSSPLWMLIYLLSTPNCRCHTATL